jgi:hypothetical protein
MSFTSNSPHLRKLFFEGYDLKEIARILHRSYQYIHILTRNIKPTKTELSTISKTIEKLHVEYENLPSYSSPLERRLERKSQNLIRRLSL